MLTASIAGGAGGAAQQPGDYFYGDMRRVFTKAGMWGLQRVLPVPGSCPTAGAGIQCLPGRMAQSSATSAGITPAAVVPVAALAGVSVPARTAPISSPDSHGRGRGGGGRGGGEKPSL
jgi:hypothetical protein